MSSNSYITNLKTIDKFEIGQFTWTISLIGEESSELLVDDEHCLGLCNFPSLNIYISNEPLCNQALKAAIIHELTHAFIFSYGIQSETYDEERICMFMECHAKTVLKMADKFYKKIKEIKKR